MGMKMDKQTVINASSGKAILENVSHAQFDRWYDHHSDYRKVRSIEEVHPDFRERYARRDDTKEVFLIQD